MQTSFIKGNSGILVVFDLSKGETFKNLNHWFDLINEYCSEKSKKLIIANKCDLNCTVFNYEIKNYCRDKGFEF